MVLKMSDFCCQLREKMIEIMQISLKPIRQVLGLGVQELADLIGLTRQTINNLETQKSKMSSIQYIAICAVIDNYLKDNPELLPIISTILCSKGNGDDSNIFEVIENGSFLKKWFLCFPDESKMLGFYSDTVSVIENEDFCNIANSCRIFLDQTVLFEEGFADTIHSLTLALKSSGNKFIIPLKVIEAVQNQMMSSNEEDMRLGQRGMKLLLSLQNEELVDIRGEKSDINIISTFVSVFAKFKYVNRLALITCDYKLANQIMLLNNNSMGGFNILVLKYSKNEGIQKWNQSDFYNKEVEQDIFINNSKKLGLEDNSFEVLKTWKSIN